MILLHLGSSTLGRENTPEMFHGEEWTHVRVDSDPNTKPDVVGDMVRLVGVDMADAIYASHSFEHLHPFDAHIALVNWKRKLHPGGLVILHIPDIQVAAERIARGEAETPLYISQAGPITPLDMVFGFRGFTYTNEPGMRHVWGYTKETLKRKFIDAGYANINVYRDLATFEVRTLCRT